MAIEIRELVIRASVPERSAAVELEQLLRQLRRELLDEMRELVRERLAAAARR